MENNENKTTEQVEEKETSDQVVKSKTKGYGYNYASLSDIANQGFTILKTKTKIDELTGKEYVWYFDEDLKEWIQGAQVVIISSPISKEGGKKMNEAQCYGAALTYARRYTMQMALGLACEDDQNIENMNANGTTKTDNKTSKAQAKTQTKAPAPKAQEKTAASTPSQHSYIERLYKPEEIQTKLKELKVSSIEKLTTSQASSLISARAGKK